jgi:chromosome segregation ATPase
MNGLTEIIDSLEIKFTKLHQKLEVLESSNQDLRNDLLKYSDIITQQSEEINQLKNQYETLKIANSLLGSDENKRETKLKINSLVREIDYCIAQLSD